MLRLLSSRHTDLLILGVLRKGLLNPHPDGESCTASLGDCLECLTPICLIAIKA